MILTAIGNLVRDPEVKDSYFSGTVAVNSYNAKTKKQETVYVKFFSNQVNMAKYLSKGRPVMISGPANVSIYTKQDGTPTISITLSSANVDFVNTGKAQSEGAAQKAEPKKKLAPASKSSEPEEELPF